MFIIPIPIILTQLFMIRTCTKLLRHCISVPRVDMTLRQIQKTQKIDFYPIVGIREQKLGACILNQPSNQNLLTQQFIDQFYRFLLSYQYDDTVQNIWLESKESVFTHGADYKQLYEDKNYLDKLNKLSILMASVNKPIFAQISGGVKGVGAYLLSMISMPFGYKNAFLKIDDVSRGMVPIMGGTHRLSRLPLHIGFYLALVGDEFNFEQMTQIGYIRGHIREGVPNFEIRKKLCEANLYFRQKFKYTDFDDDQTLLEFQQRTKVQQQKELFHEKMKFRQGELLGEPRKNVNIKFATNQHLAASSDFYNTTNPYNSFTENRGRTVNNYYQMRLQRPLAYLKKHNLVESFEIVGVQIARLDLAKIDFIFGKNSLEEVLAALKQEQSEWAQKAYAKINKADPLALHLTFRLLKQAEKQPWIKCLENEFSVARRLIQKSTLKLNVYNKSSQYAFTNEFSDKNISDITPEIIDWYFSGCDGDYKFEHNVPTNSLHPYRDYYQDVPDSVRTYLNREQFMDKHLDQQDKEVIRYLNQNKINYASQVYDVNILRAQIYERLELEKQKDLITKRLAYISANDSYLQTYQTERESYLDSIDHSFFQQLISNEVKSVIQAKFDNRFRQFEEKTAGMIGFQSKIELFKNIKNILLQNIIHNGVEYERRQKENTQFNGPIYFDDKGRDIYSTTNPTIATTEPLKKLASSLSTGVQLSQQFLKHQAEELPKFFGLPNQLQKYEIQQRKMWDLIKYRYDQKPEVWAQAYVYKQLIEQASSTSQELAGYMEWTFENFYDLINYSDKKRETYGQFAADIVSEMKKIRVKNINQLKEVQGQRQILLQKGLFSKVYELHEEKKMREIFPYYIDQSSIPGQFKRSFLSTLDSALKQFTSIYKVNKKSLLLKEELGILDRWINKDITSQYTGFLKNDVQYVTSYLQILIMKDLMIKLNSLKEEKIQLEKIVEILRDNYNVDFHFHSNQITLQDIDAKIFSFLYFLMDLHSNSKRNIKSPQNKLIDFINRLKNVYEDEQDSSMPVSFESLILMIAKDRKKIYDRFLGQKFIAEPQFYLSHVTKESKKTSNDIYLRNPDLKEVMDTQILKNYIHQHSDVYGVETNHLVQNYFYYMMLFEKQIHNICGKKSFIPEGFVNKEHKVYNQYCAKLLRSKSHKNWLQEEVRAVIEQLLNQRQIIEQKLTKGQLFLFDQQFSRKLQPQSVKQLIRSKLVEEIYLIKNIFIDPRQYDFEANEEEKADQQYTRHKRAIKNADALKKLNNLGLAQEIYLEYMMDTEEKDDMTQQERRFAQNQRQYFKHGFVTRLPFKSYHRMARDLFKYPEQMTKTPNSSQETELFKKTNLTFSKAAAGERINLSNFTPQYKTLILNPKMKDQILSEIVSKIKMVQSL